MVLVAPPGRSAAWRLMTMLVRRITKTVLDLMSSNPTSFSTPIRTLAAAFWIFGPGGPSKNDLALLIILNYNSPTHDFQYHAGSIFS